MKGVFEISGTSRYDDVITERYHFPRIYLRIAERFVGDWVLYRETGSDGGRKAYVAVARVERIDPDASDASLFYAACPISSKSIMPSPTETVTVVSPSVSCGNYPASPSRAAR